MTNESEDKIRGLVMEFLDLYKKTKKEFKGASIDFSIAGLPNFAGSPPPSEEVIQENLSDALYRKKSAEVLLRRLKIKLQSLADELEGKVVEEKPYDFSNFENEISVLLKEADTVKASFDNLLKSHGL